MSTKDILKKSALEMFAQYNAPRLGAALLAALLLGIFIYLVYRRFYTGVIYSRSFAVTLVGMCILTCMVTLAISTNVVISLGMIGALSIVRFRTAIKDPMDLLYLFWAITTGITTGVGMYALGLITALVMVEMVVLFYARQEKGRIYVAVVHYTGQQAGDAVIRAFDRNKFVVKSKTLRREDTELAAEVFCREKELEFTERLRSIEGVRDVTLIQYTMASTMVKRCAAAVLACLALAGSGCFTSGVRRADYPADDTAFANPQMGYAPTVRSTEYTGVTLRYLQLTWREAEPEEGVFAWQALEEYYHLAALREEGVHLVLRFVCDDPGNTQHLDIPDWLYAQTGNGSWYTTSYGSGYSPDYADPVFRAAHRRVLLALGQWLGNDGFVSYVELGSLGHWGEWHIKENEGLVPMPGESIRDAYVRDYQAVFPQAKLLMRRPFRIAAEEKLGLYNDMAGAPEDTQEWIGWITQGGWYGQEPDALTAMPEFWRSAPAGGELTSADRMDNLLSRNLQQTLALVRCSHMTFLGPMIADPAYRTGYEALLKELGYRLRVRSAQLSASASGSSVTLNFINEGSVPFYWDWTVNLYVEDANGTTLETQPLALQLSTLAARHGADCASGAAHSTRRNRNAAHYTGHSGPHDREGRRTVCHEGRT